MAVAFTYKTFQLNKELDYVSPFYHHELSGRIISGSIYSSIILSFGLLLGYLLSVHAILYISSGSALLILPLYIFLVRPHHDTLIKNESILYRIPFIEKIHFKKILRDYLKKQKLSDLEYSVLDEYPELLAKYFHIQFVLNECLSVFLSYKYDRKYLRSILNDLNELSSFYEKLRETTDNYVNVNGKYFSIKKGILFSIPNSFYFLNSGLALLITYSSAGRIKTGRIVYADQNGV